MERTIEAECHQIHSLISNGSVVWEAKVQAVPKKNTTSISCWSQLKPFGRCIQGNVGTDSIGKLKGTTTTTTTAAAAAAATTTTTTTTTTTASTTTTTATTISNNIINDNDANDTKTTTWTTTLQLPLTAQSNTRNKKHHLTKTFESGEQQTCKWIHIVDAQSFLQQHRNFILFKAMCKEVEDSETKTMYHTLPKSVSLGTTEIIFHGHSSIGFKTTTQLSIARWTL